MTLSTTSDRQMITDTASGCGSLALATATRWLFRYMNTWEGMNALSSSGPLTNTTCSRYLDVPPVLNLGGVSLIRSCFTLVV